MNCKCSHSVFQPLRSVVDTRSVRLVAKDLNARPVLKERPSWSTARDFVGVVHAALKQAMKAAESEAATNHCDTPAAQTQRNKRDGPRIATFLDFEEEGEALETSEELNKNQVTTALRSGHHQKPPKSTKLSQMIKVAHHAVFLFGQSFSYSEVFMFVIVSGFQTFTK